MSDKPASAPPEKIEHPKAFEMEPSNKTVADSKPKALATKEPAEFKEDLLGVAPTPTTDSINDHKTKAKWGQHAVVVRRSQHGGDKPWSIESIAINSSPLLLVLRTHLSQYPGLAMASKKFCFNLLSRFFFHFWNETLEDFDAENDPRARAHFNTFKEVMAPELDFYFEKKEECEKHGKIEFGFLWTLFKPGALIHWDEEGKSNVGRLTEVFRGTIIQTIPHFGGHRSISEVPAPLEMRSDRDNIKNIVTRRGKKFESLKGYHFKAYDGSVRITNTNRDFALRSPKQVIVVRML
ncbi:hypothetical protein GQ44DRAFT_775558 [Phaeosphaeriaceae sp. PMI808]|nr:hypothetical protein GQ44DRAFT_775558 [Phaeosphaeriaceae sp. PMI808]